MTPKRTPKGASLTEYGMLGGLIALVAITTVLAFGGTVQNIFCLATEAVSNEEGSCLDLAGNPGGGEGGEGEGGAGEGGGGEEPPPPPPVTGMVLRYEGTQAQFQVFDSAPGDVVVEWGDGTTTAYGGVGSFTFQKTFGTPGPHTVVVNGAADRFQSQSPEQLREVVSFGNLGWTSLENAFVNHDLLDAVGPLPATVTNLTGTFMDAEGVLAGVESWQVAQVTTFSETFRDSATFNRAIGAWDTAGATSMARMFQGAEDFNQPIGTWNVANVTTMSNMFARATSFNQDLTAWATANTTDMSGMFDGAIVFNGDISAWDITGISAPAGLSTMFRGAAAFNGNLSDWCVTAVPYRPTQFANGSAILGEPAWGYCGAPALGEEPMVMTLTGSTAGFIVYDTLPSDVVIDWGDGTSVPYTSGTSQTFSKNYGSVGTRTVRISGTFSRFRSNSTASLVSVDSFGSTGVTNLSNAFQSHTALASLAPLPDTVTTLVSTFESATSALAGVENWYTGNVTSLNRTFNGATNFNRAIGGWDTSKVTDMTNTFSSASAFNQDLDWSTGNVTLMSFMFSNAASFNGNISGWDVSSINLSTAMTAMFQGANAFRGNLSQWCVDGFATRPINFATANQLTAEPVWGYCGAPEPSPDAMVFTFTGSIAALTTTDTAPSDVVVHWGDGSVTPATTAVNSFSRSYATNGTYTVRVSGTFSRIQVTGLAQGALTSIDSFGNTGVTSLQSAFLNTHNLSSVAALPSTVTNLSSAFQGSNGSLVGVESWNVANVTNMQNLFNNASAFNRDIGTWNVAGVTNFGSMFRGATSFNRDLPWTTTAATDMSSMFNNASVFNGNITGWDMPNVARNQMANMFQGASAFNRDIRGWCVSAATTRPISFTSFAANIQFPEPLWGTCPP